MDNLTTSLKESRVLNATAAGTSDVQSTGVDMTGFEGVEYTVLLGTLTAGQVTVISVQESDDDGSVDDYDDDEGSGVTLNDSWSNKLIRIELVHPRKKYNRLNFNRGTQNAGIDGAIAKQYGARYRPITDHSSVAATKLLISPKEGTA